MNGLHERIKATFLRGSLLPAEDYIPLLGAASEAMESESPDVRPRDSKGQAGGLIELDSTLPTILLPDIHARMELLINVLLGPQWSALDRLGRSELQLVCVGDGFHSEARAVRRWAAAYQEYRQGFLTHAAMDQEMIESLGAMEIVMLLKAAFGPRFHFLKGNHENIANEHGHGNYPFMKFVDEGAMVAEYVRRFLGTDFLREYYRFEKNFPLLAVGSHFLVSHGEPERVFGRGEVIEYRQRGEVVLGFTWTDNDAAEEGSVQGMLEAFLGSDCQPEPYYFGGHRPVPGLYRLRAGGRYVQFHNPDKLMVVSLTPGEPFDPDRGVVELADRSSELIA